MKKYIMHFAQMEPRGCVGAINIIWSFALCKYPINTRKISLIHKTALFEIITCI